jgi:hypothetical protein
MAVALRSKIAEDAAVAKQSRHFESLQIFTTHAEPGLDEFLTRKEQVDIEQKQSNEEDKLYRCGC